MFVYYHSLYLLYTTNKTFYMYCGLMLIHGDQCLWIVNILLALARGDVISWVTGLLHHNYITLWNVRGYVNSWVRVTLEILEHRSPTNNNDCTVCMIKSTKPLQLYTVGSLIALIFSILYLDIFLKKSFTVPFTACVLAI